MDLEKHGIYSQTLDMMIDHIIIGDYNETTKACYRSLVENSHYDKHYINYIREPFDGYNRSLNNGAKKGFSKYIAFCNNDLEFTRGWDINIIDALENQDKIVSASPWCPLTHKQWWGNEIPKENVIGTQTGKIVAGWCLVLKREWWEEMGGFDERMEFWCCDNSYTMQLEAAGKKHGLIIESHVKHLFSNTLNQFKGTPRYEELTMGQVRKFNRLYNQNLFNAGT